MLSTPKVGDKPTPEHAARQLEADVKRLADKWNASLTIIRRTP